MIKVPGYETSEKVYEGQRSRVYQGRRLSDHLPVIIKTHSLNYPPPSEINRFRREFEIGSQFIHPNIIRYHELVPRGHGLAIVSENEQATGLAGQIPKDGFDPTTFLKIAVQLAEGLGAIHRKNIIHKDIKPCNIILHKESGRVQFIDFGNSIRSNQDGTPGINSGTGDGTLAYMSPEQTGRVNRGVDYRTDFYSLGCTFYELLCGRPPFKGGDSLELIHSQIAKSPPLPCDLRPDVPQPISDIIMKLLEKSAEDRYQSDLGLKADLTRCLSSMEKTGGVEIFAVGRDDVSERFRVPQRFYGRKKEIEILMETFERACWGSVELLFISGQAGVGKSTLINEIRTPIATKRGYFVAGRFDEIRQDIPHSAITRACQDLVREVLTENERSIQRWKSLMSDALGVHGQILADLIPALGSLLDSPDTVAALEDGNTQSNFNQVFRKFVRLFARQEHPLVLFLDDLQWADAASLKLLEGLITDPEMEYLMIIGSCREKALTGSNLLNQAMMEMKVKGASVRCITLSPLTLENITEMLTDMFQERGDDIPKLASLVERKTKGNTFFVKKFLLSLHQRKILWFEAKEKRWEWDCRRASEMGATANVVDLLIGQVRELPEKTLILLCMAACLGTRFHIRTLAALAEISMRELVIRLLPAIQQGFLFTQNMDEIALHDFLENEAADLNSGDFVLGFAHDRVQYAAYKILSPVKRAMTHLKIGQHLRENQGGGFGEALYEIVDHFNKGRRFIKTSDQLNFLLKANITAGKKAKNAAAFQTARDHFIIARDTLPDDYWKTSYSLAFEVYKNLAECQWFCHAIDEAEFLFEVLLKHAATREDRAEVCLNIISIYTYGNELRKAIYLGVQALELFNVKLPLKPSRALIAWERIKTGWNLGFRPTTSLAKAPPISDPTQKAVINLLMVIIPAAYQSGNLQLFTLISLKMVNIALRHGTSEASAYAYMLYAVLSRIFQRGFKHGDAFAELGLELADRIGSPLLTAKINFTFAAMVNGRTKHYATNQAILEAGYQAGIESGDTVYANWCLFHKTTQMLFMGRNLEELEKELTDLIQGLGIHGGYRHRLDNIRLVRQFVRNLRGRTDGPLSLNDVDFNEDEHMKYIKAKGFQTGQGIMYSLKAAIAYHLGEYEAALELSERADRIIHAFAGLPFEVETIFYHVLILAALHPNVPAEKRREYQRQMSVRVNRLDAWAAKCPDNFEHKALMARAELERTKGEPAAEFYDRAVESAERGGFRQYVALANELAGRLWLSRGKEKIADVYMTEAYFSYTRWGAKRKIELLQSQYGGHLPGIRRELLRLNQDASYSSEMSGPSSSSKSHGVVDFATVGKASLAISEEIDLQKLLEKIMAIIVENAGAQRAFLILKQDGDLLINASLTSAADGLKVMQAAPMTGKRRLSRAIVRFVIRTGEDVILQNAAVDGLFTKDPYILEHRPKSILCIPMRQKDEINGALYLENNLTANAFTESRVEVLRVLLAQAGISLENARNYSEISGLNTALTKEIADRRKAEAEVRGLNKDLEARVEARTAELKAAQEELVEKAHQAGMADIATSVLHNLGNILTSVLTSGQMIDRTLKTSKLQAMKKANDLLAEHEADLADFLQNDPKGPQLIQFFAQLEKQINVEHKQMGDDLHQLLGDLESMRDVIMAQHNYASAGYHAETLSLRQVVEDTLNLKQATFDHLGITIQTRFECEPRAKVQKTKLVNILVNLLDNAEEAMRNLQPSEKMITLTIFGDDSHSHIQISDSGEGIEGDLLKKIFNHGFTTKRDKQGFGLHGCANYMTEMGGKIRAESDGKGKGATFILSFPKSEQSNNGDTQNRVA